MLAPRERQELAARTRAPHLLHHVAALAELFVDLAPELARGGRYEIRVAARRDAHARARVLQACRVESEDLGLARRRQRWIAVLRLKLVRDLKAAERLDDRLRRTEPQAVGTPHDPILAD